jgi:hypothetical protein
MQRAGLAALMTGLSAKDVFALETVTLPFDNVVKSNCSACHSADYVQIQPRGEKFKKDFWQAEVTKMIKIYGAPIDDTDVAKIVEYLAATY